MSLIGARLAIDNDVNGAALGEYLAGATPEQVGIVAQYLAELAASLVLLHLPERLIFGGGVIKAPGLGDDAGITGAIALGRRALGRK